MEYTAKQLEEKAKELRYLEKVYYIKHYLKLILLISFLCFIFWQPIEEAVGFNLKYGRPVYKTFSKIPINLNEPPLQTELTEPFPKIKIEDHKNVKIIPVANYSISGMMVVKNSDFDGLWKNEFDEISTIDIGLVWGKIADIEFLDKNFLFYSDKAVKGRWLKVIPKGAMPEGFTFDEISSLFSHTHVIPADDNIFAILMKVKKYEPVRLNGYLVNVQGNNWGINTSLSRLDQGAYSCEVMYVNSVQVGNKIYK
jgi:hypothetical protein